MHSKASNMPPPLYAAKPTTYRGVRFRSRTEARWAIVLDNMPSVSSWVYEPFTWELTTPKGLYTYTPDFTVCTRDCQEVIIETKPKEPTDDYVKYLQMFTKEVKGNLTILVGSFYKSRPSVIHLSRGSQVELCPKYSLDPRELNAAYPVAAAHRFDI